MALEDALEAAEKTHRNMNAIHDNSEQATYCVGRTGLIFRFDGTSWSAVESSTHATLQCVHCALDGWVYAAGQSGVLLQGDEKGFHALHAGVTDDFYAMTWFAGHLYVGGLKGLYKLDPYGLQLVDTGQGSFSCVALDSINEQLLVVAEHWLLVFDGAGWRRIENPDNV